MVYREAFPGPLPCSVRTLAIREPSGDEAFASQTIESPPQPTPYPSTNRISRTGRKCFVTVTVAGGKIRFNPCETGVSETGSRPVATPKGSFRNAVSAASQIADVTGLRTSGRVRLPE